MFSVGILGGGQLGRMLLQAAANYPVLTHVLEKEDDCPAAHLCHVFTRGDISNFEDVYEFGKGLDAIAIEIESVNLEALAKLELEGVRVYPRVSALGIIKNKILQKEFYKKNEVPSPAFVTLENRETLRGQAAFLPAVQKLATGGYDGRGVQMIHTPPGPEEGFDAPSVLEKLVDIQKEIAIIIAVNEKGQTAVYPPVDMVFNKTLHLLDYQISPAELPEKTLWKLEAVALRVVRALQSPGIFAIELFVDKQGEVFVNETAPRVHNSGHHTIEASFSSQFDMLWRIILGYPLGNTASILPAAIVNLLGEEGYSGEAFYKGLPETLRLDNVFVHIYGKKQTKPGRKMGHITLLGKDKQDLVRRAHQIREELRVITNP